MYEGWLLQQRFDDGTGRDPEEIGEEYVGQIAQSFAQVPAERYPAIVANADAIVAGGSDERFAFGIDMLIAGFAAQVSSRPSAPPAGTP